MTIKQENLFLIPDHKIVQLCQNAGENPNTSKSQKKAQLSKDTYTRKAEVSPLDNTIQLPILCIENKHQQSYLLK